MCACMRVDVAFQINIFFSSSCYEKAGTHVKIDIWWAAVIISSSKIQLNENVIKHPAGQNTKAKMTII